MRTELLLFCILFFVNIESQSLVYILVHGTWGAESTWYSPGGDFFDALESTVTSQKGFVVPFRWSGANSNEARDRAAQSLAKLIQTYKQNNISVNIIGHSHGGTVALLASHILENNSIDLVYTLGMPVNRFLYPNMAVINYCYNLFSFEDLIQPVLGVFGREHKSHNKIANIRVVIDSKEPDHSTMHHEIIGKWIPHIHREYTHFLNTEHNINNLLDPGIIYLYSTKKPTYDLDTKRKDLIERDHQLSLLILNSFRRSFDTGSKIPLTNR